MESFHFILGDSPLLISSPHSGTYIPPEISDLMTDVGKSSKDADWHIHELYEFAQLIGASMIIATHSRYVVDLNRPADGKPLYPGQSETGLVPLASFDDEALYREGHEPDTSDLKDRVKKYWRPYHDKIRDTLNALKARHGYARLFDVHSIAQEVPKFFEGKLPDLNIGTNDGKSAHADIGRSLLKIAEEDGQYSTVLNGRFKGGYITRHYGQPEHDVDAVQLEMSQAIYLKDDDSFIVDTSKSAKVTPVLERMITYLMA